MDESLPIEKRPIPGVNTRTLVWVIGGICGFVIFVVSTYFSILTKLNDTQRMQEVIQKDVTEIKENRKTENSSINSSIYELKKQFQDMQLKQLRYEIILKEKGILPLE